MKTDEKILFLQLLLKDLSLDWSNVAKYRVKYAKKLSTEIAEETQNESFIVLAENCDFYIKQSHNDYFDGRYFRVAFPYGYLKMQKLHNLKATVTDKSQSFKNDVFLFACPHLLFCDWNKYIKTEIIKRIEQESLNESNTNSSNTKPD